MTTPESDLDNVAQPDELVVEGVEDDLFDPLAEDDSTLPAKEVIGDHRGAFGEFGGAETGFLDRAFRERIILVGVTLDGTTKDETQTSLDEMALLVATAGADVADRIVQTRQAPDASTFIGKGKAQEVLESALAHDADTVVGGPVARPSVGAARGRRICRTRCAVASPVECPHVCDRRRRRRRSPVRDRPHLEPRDSPLGTHGDPPR